MAEPGTSRGSGLQAPVAPRQKQPRTQQPEQQPEWWLRPEYSLDEEAVIAEAQRRIERGLLQPHTKKSYGNTCPSSTADFGMDRGEVLRYGCYGACSRLLSLDGVACFR